MALQGGSCVSFFTPRGMPNLARPAVSMMSGTLRVPKGGVQLMSHYRRAKKKPRLINRLFLNASDERKAKRGIFLKSGGKPPVGWV
ncbi:hypothetical protein EMIT0P258_260005 [Pseudomonas sp. IT-P258]